MKPTCAWCCRRSWNVTAIAFRLRPMAKPRCAGSRKRMSMYCSATSTCRGWMGWRLRRVHERPNPPEVIMLTGQATVETAVEAMKLGAYDYLTKPYSIIELDVRVKQAADKRRLRVDNTRLREQLARQSALPE